MAKAKNVKKAKFSPDKNYKWTPETKFVLDGIEFDTLIKTLRAATFSTNVAPIELVSAYNILNNKFIEGVENGDVVENNEEEEKR